MIGGKINVVFRAITLCVGIFVGASGYSFLFCPNTDKAIVKQLKEDDKTALVIEKKAKVQEVKDVSFNKAVDNSPDTTGCSTVPDDALYDLLLDPQYN
jgi:hypothetical protein